MKGAAKMTIQKTIEIKGKTYPEPSIDRMKRKAIKKLQPNIDRLKNEELDALWDLVGLLVPGLSVAVLDDMELGECKKLLNDSGIVKLEDADTGKDDADAEGEGITPGESLALTDS